MIKPVTHFLDVKLDTNMELYDHETYVEDPEELDMFRFKD